MGVGSSRSRGRLRGTPSDRMRRFAENRVISLTVLLTCIRPFWLKPFWLVDRMTSLTCILHDLTVLHVMSVYVQLSMIMLQVTSVLTVLHVMSVYVQLSMIMLQVASVSVQLGSPRTPLVASTSALSMRHWVPQAQMTRGAGSGSTTIRVLR